MFQPGVTLHLDKSDRVEPGLTRDPGAGRVITSVKVVAHDDGGTVVPTSLTLVASPRVLRRIAEELVAAADEACRREDALSDTVLPFEAVQ